jgi:hypothetical protein
VLPIPDEFNKLCLMFHQDVTFLYPTPEKAIDAALGSLTAAEKEVVRRFLDRLLKRPNPGAEAKRAWRRSPADFQFQKTRDAAAFLRLIREALG